MVSFKKEHFVIAPRMESCCMGFVILGLGSHSKHVQVKRLELTESFPPNSKISNGSLHQISSNSPWIWNKGSSCLICNWEFGSKFAV